MMPPKIIPLSEIPTLSLLYKLKHLSPPATSASLPQPSKPLNSLISLIRTDITNLQVSAIVNAANNSLLGGGGVDGAIHRRAGPKLYDECETLDGCETGSAKITSAYELPCEKVIHAVGPVYWEARRQQLGLEKRLLKGCYRTSLDLAHENGCRSIAFSAISTGVYGYPSSEAAEAAIGEVSDWVQENWKAGDGLERIIFCCFEMKDVRAYEEWLPKFFPPTDDDIPKDDPKHDELVNEMPDPPTTEPTEAGKPDAKKPKLDGGKAEEALDDWETVEKPTRSVEHDMVDDPFDDERPMTIEEQIEYEEAKENQLRALGTAENDGGILVGSLGRDW